MSRSPAIFRTTAPNQIRNAGNDLYVQRSWGLKHKIKLFLALLRVLQNTLDFQSSASLFQGPCLYPRTCQLVFRPKRKFSLLKSNRIYVRCVGLENICDASGNQASDKSVIPDVLPPLLLVLFARLDAKKISARGIVVATVVSSTHRTPCRERADGLRLAQQAARPQNERGIASRHCRARK